MDIILNLIKCMVCHKTYESPLILPCYHSVCEKHVSNEHNGVIRCEKCGVEHQIPTNGFQPNNILEAVLESGIANLDFGSVHKSAKKSCESLEDSLKQLELLLKDPNAFTHEKITELKDIVQLKGEELKLIIDQEMKKLIDKLEEYEKESKLYLSSNEFKVESQKLDNELKISESSLNSWLENLNKINFDEENWKYIKIESGQKIKCITKKMDELKNKLLLNKFDKNQKHVNCFKYIKIDSLFEYVNRDFLVSRIIDENLAKKLDELLKKKELNDRNWSLLYQGSRDGFRASDFHSHCNGKPNTLTIVKSTMGNIFGGFTSADWKSSATASFENDKKSFGSFEYDFSAFIYSLVNKENRPLIFEHSSSNEHSICSNDDLGPAFGLGMDFVINDRSNLNKFSYSCLGVTYTHPEYPLYSEKAETILAGSSYFQVQEIEVFQMQQNSKNLFF